MRGASSHVWTPDAVLVDGNAPQAIFNHVKPSAQSVYASVTMFHDIARLTLPPRRIAVVENMDSMGDYTSILGQAADVIGATAPDEVYLALAA